MTEVEFREWPKIQRLNKNIVSITEKIDGTNACIIIDGGEIVGVQSRKRLITPEDDNFGFAGWVSRNTEKLKTLGDGYHYGEWAGLGIQKNPHGLDGKEFFLFDWHRYVDNHDWPALEVCRTVPHLYTGNYSASELQACVSKLKLGLAGVGEGRETSPEGVVVYFHAFRQQLKHIIRESDKSETRG